LGQLSSNYGVMFKFCELAPDLKQKKVIYAPDLKQKK